MTLIQLQIATALTMLVTVTHQTFTEMIILITEVKPVIDTALMVIQRRIAMVIMETDMAAKTDTEVVTNQTMCMAADMAEIQMTITVHLEI